MCGAAVFIFCKFFNYFFLLYCFYLLFTLINVLLPGLDKCNPQITTSDQFKFIEQSKSWYSLARRAPVLYIHMHVYIHYVYSVMPEISAEMACLSASNDCEIFLNIFLEIVPQKIFCNLLSKTQTFIENYLQIHVCPVLHHSLLFNRYFSALKV